MKYSDSNPPLVCMMTQSTCYKGTSTGTPVGILWHDTGAGNPWLKRYVQPDDNASNKAELLSKIGVNANKNDFNHINRQAGLNCWVGKMADGNVSTIQTMPWNYRPWGCGGACNGKTGGPFWIQFEICDDGWSNATNSYSNGTKEYFLAAYKEACEITAYLCKKFNIDPYGYVNLNGKKVPTILCHYDSYKLGCGSGHYDIYGYFNKYGYNMDSARADVAALLGDTSSASSTVVTPTTPAAASNFKAGDLVSIKSGATYYNGKVISSWVLNNKWYIENISGDRAVINKSKDGKYAIMSAINTKYLEKVTSTNSSSSFQSYVIRVTTDELNVRSGPGTNYGIKTVLKKGGAYTIIEEQNNWGKLKSGIGWISLKYTEKIK